MTTEGRYKHTDIGVIPEDWEVKEIKDFFEIDSTVINPLKSEEFTFYHYSIPAFDNNKTPEIQKGIEIESNKTRLRPPSILVSKLNPRFRRIWKINSCFPYSISSTEFIQLRFKIKDYESFLDFFTHILSSNIFIKYLASHVKGTSSSHQRVNPKDILGFKFGNPTVEESIKIGKMLSDLDSKIELNQQMNKTLEAIGQAIFKHWFIDFEFPNEEGKPYKSSGGEMIYIEELGEEIPKGWKVGKLGDCGAFKNGINYLRNEKGDTDFFIANVRDIANNKLLLKESLDKIRIDFKKAEDYLLNDRDILIARSASPGEISLVLGNLEKVIYSGFSIRYRLNNPDNYLYLFLILQGLKNNLLNFSIGTTLQSVNQETLKNMRFILPSDKILKEFNIIIEHILNKSYNNLIQNKNLSQIRDSLLPKLMSGKIRVNMSSGADSEV